MRDYKQEIIKRKKQFSQRELAKQFGTSEQYFGQVLNGKKKCPKKRQALLNKILKNL